MIRINISNHKPGTSKILNEIAELSDGATTGIDNYNHSLFIEIFNESDVEIITDLIKEKGLMII
jgi:hypothetical protein